MRETELKREISRFMKRQVEDQKLAKKRERIQVSIKPDSYIGKEIQYQTALLHEILAEVRENKGSVKAAPESQTEKAE